MRVLGVDAGSSRTGYALVVVENKNYRLEDAGVVRLDLAPFGKLKMPQRLAELYQIIGRIGQRLRPDFSVVEKIRVRNGGNNLDAYIATARSMQTVELALVQTGIEVVEALAAQTRSVMRIGGRARKEQKEAGIRLANAIYAERLKELGWPDGLKVSAEHPDCDVSDAILMATAGDRLRLRTEEFSEE